MKNQKGEVVTGVVVLLMVAMMFIGMPLMHGDRGHHGHHSNHDVKEHQEHDGKDSHHMHGSNAENAHQHVDEESK